MKALFNRTPRLDGVDAASKRQEIRDYFHVTFNRYEQLFETLASDEAYYRKPITLRHPLIFYFGHTATFFINKLTLAGLVTKRINPAFESMFAIGVDEMSWDDLDETNYDWPTVAEVRAYRNEVRRVIDDLVATLPLELPIHWDHPWWPILMGIEHERIHLETSSVLIRQHALHYVKPHPDWRPCPLSGEAPINEMVRIPAGKITLGKTDATYGWDNEYGHHEAEVTAFQAARYLVSNHEFLEFVEAGGYGDDSVWEDEGRQWKNYVRATHPTFWIPDGNNWRLRLMTEEVPMRWDWPAEVNYHEAKAFCNWKKVKTGLPVRLPTEDEWTRLHEFSGLAEVPHDHRAEANLHLDHYASSCPVTQFRHGELYDVVGNVWQWTETPIYPFDGFRVHPLYDDFTTPTFDDRHNLIKGGSWISCGDEALKSARYAFRRHFFQHAGFRTIVSDIAPPDAIPASRYETDALLSEYAEFHYGDEYFGVPNFSQALAKIAIAAMQGKPMRHALDIGCAAGRATFELARHFERVTGIDFSARFIGLGVQLAQNGILRYTLKDEGELVLYKERRLDQLGLDAMRDKVEFFQGDACNLKPHFTGYDFILAANLIDRLYSPRKFLAGIHERLNPGGVLMIASPYTWLEEHTPRDEWLGGFKQAGENMTTLDGLKAALNGHFRLMEKPREVPFVIRETRHKFQHSLSEVTLWERIA
ncbi:MAG: 5-histidylcysteine sulfoxide synthase [Methylobacillus sp.]|jgi:5-histidylcysteine sulfoxide synthase/putative 4-mercaptohistidine N1-methyltranferase|nr:5-histidylcysteine sulfoxide synthase [Methylobacillus sp.]